MSYSKIISVSDFGLGVSPRLSPGNRIHKLFELEAELEPEKTREAYKKLVELINIIKLDLAKPTAGAPLTIIDKVLRAYKAIEMQGYTFKTHSALFSQNILRGEVDCDDSCFIILALADELKAASPEWATVGLVALPMHTLVEVNGSYIDFGEIFPKQFYIDGGNFQPDRIDSYMKPCVGEDIYFLFYDNLGLAKANLNDFSGAKAAFEQAIAYNPEDSVAYFNVGLAKANLGDYDGAIAEYNKSIELHSTFAEAYFDLGTAKAKLNDWVGAKAAYEKAAELNPADADAYYNLGYSESVLRNYAGAIAAYKNSIELNPAYARVVSLLTLRIKLMLHW